MVTEHASAPGTPKHTCKGGPLTQAMAVLSSALSVGRRGWDLAVPQMPMEDRGQWVQKPGPPPGAYCFLGGESGNSGTILGHIR